MKILVTGAAGRVGTAAVFALLNRGAQVRAMLHRPDRHAMFAPCDLECVTADLDDGPAVRAALSGVEAVLLISPLHPNLPVREIGLIEACSEGTARRVVKSPRSALTRTGQCRRPAGMAWWSVIFVSPPCPGLCCSPTSSFRPSSSSPTR
jgi:uncharacterized protein YbjT (DUF2867 family)